MLFVCFSTGEKRIVVVAKTLYPRFVSYCEYRISSLNINVTTCSSAKYGKRDVQIHSLGKHACPLSTGHDL